uniref:Uncharacterized protein n=1 Tax=Rhizophora mucronata TaxID=61149 RepID=A0A2P2N5Q7_RHIMU
MINKESRINKIEKAGTRGEDVLPFSF